MSLIVSCPQTAGAEVMHFDHVPGRWDFFFALSGANWIGWTAEQREAVSNYRETLLALALAGF